MKDTEDYQLIRRQILQVMNEAGLQVDHTLRELQGRANPDAWARIEVYLKARPLTGSQRIRDLLSAIQPGAVELRKHTRFPVDFRSTFSGSTILEGGGTVLDLSLGGCRVESPASVQVGLVVDLRIYVPGLDWPLLIDEAAVRWVRGSTFGLAFLRLGQTEDERLRQVLKGAGANQKP
ncbi:MAG: PilZ domain-containing protein [Nitrospirae bacterium]|nr:MAG: PilZ domain-containing protein [Nitrospirota bacterium]